MPEGKYISFYFVIESIGQHYKTKTDSLNIKILCVAILLRWRNLLTLGVRLSLSQCCFMPKPTVNLLLSVKHSVANNKET